jgi:hypothetical protein
LPLLKLSPFVDLLQMVVDRIHLHAEQLSYLLLGKPEGLFLLEDLDMNFTLRGAVEDDVRGVHENE